MRKVTRGSLAIASYRSASELEDAMKLHEELNDAKSEPPLKDALPPLKEALPPLKEALPSHGPPAEGALPPAEQMRHICFISRFPNTQIYFVS